MLCATSDPKHSAEERSTELFLCVGEEGGEGEKRGRVTGGAPVGLHNCDAVTALSKKPSAVFDREARYEIALHTALLRNNIKWLSTQVRYTNRPQYPSRRRVNYIERIQ
jgi:hypothetical protein